jgi:flagellin
VSIALDYDGTVGTDSTIEATLNEGYVGGAAVVADAGETITSTITNNRTGATTSTITVNVLTADDSDDLETNIGAAIDTALGANVLEVTNGAGGATAALECVVGAAANDADSFTINSFTSTANGAFDSGIANGTNIELDAITETRLTDKLNAAVAADSGAAATGLRFIADTANGAVDFAAGQDISYTATNTATGSNIGDFVSGLATVLTAVEGGGLLRGFSSVEQGTFLESSSNSGGAQSTSGATVDDPSVFQSLANGNDIQNLSVAVKDPSGAVQTLNIALDRTNALTIDEAVNAINDQLQQSNNSTLQGLLAVKERVDGTTDGIRFLGGADTEFSVSASGLATGNGINGGTATTLSSTALEGGSVADISSRENAENAVSLLAAAVSKLGTLQANVGRGQNRLQFAIGLATTQLTNLSAAESRIRDADLATEAANLTRTSIAQQAGVAALAQANSAPQAVLALLRGQAPA